MGGGGGGERNIKDMQCGEVGQGTKGTRGNSKESDGLRRGDKGLNRKREREKISKRGDRCHGKNKAEGWEVEDGGYEW